MLSATAGFRHLFWYSILVLLSINWCKVFTPLVWSTRHHLIRVPVRDQAIYFIAYVMLFFLKHGARMTHEQLILDIVSVLYVN